MVATDLHMLFKSFFGEQTEVKLTEQEYNRLQHIILSAWDWNQILKGSVIVLGDFQPMAYPNDSHFEPRCMEEFEPNRGQKISPGIAICTIALGLVVSRSKVKGDVPGEEVICKAFVVTEQRYN